jgi:predicted nucleotidyltransferase
MIPQFNKLGYLSKGIHKVSLNDIKKRFGSGNSWRKYLFKKLESFVELLSRNKENVERLLVNGSFVTDKETPNDIDCILVVKNSFDFRSKDAKKLINAKKQFNIHLQTFTEDDKGEFKGFLDLFSHDRDRNPKGLLEVKL